MLYNEDKEQKITRQEQAKAFNAREQLELNGAGRPEENGTDEASTPLDPGPLYSSERPRGLFACWGSREGPAQSQIKPVEVERCKRDAICRSDARNRLFNRQGIMMEEREKKKLTVQKWSSKPS